MFSLFGYSDNPDTRLGDLHLYLCKNLAKIDTITMFLEMWKPRLRENM